MILNQQADAGRVVRLRARLPDQRRAAAQPAPRRARRGLRRGRDVRHEQRIRVRLPARQHGRRARPAGAARALLRDRRRGRQHPHRRGADTAHHLRSGRGVGRPVLHVRPPRAAPQGTPRGRGGGRRLLHRPQGPCRQPDRGGRPQDGGLAGRREPVRRRPAARPPLRAGAARPRPVQARPRLHRQGRRDRHRRRVHRSADAGPPLERGPPPGDRGQGGAARPARERDPRHDHLPELLPPLRQARRHDRHGDDRGRGVPQDLQARGRRHPDPPGDDPDRRGGPRVPRREGQVQRPHRRDRRDAGDRPAGPRRHGQRREVRDPLGDAQAPRHQARDAQREVPREGVGHRRPGRPHRRGHHRHEHGRPRHRHPARRQPGGPRVGRAHRQRGSTRPRSTRTTYDAALDEAKAITEEDHVRVVEAGGPPHHRHRAPRVAADRQPAPRPRRPPGRPRVVAVLPVARRRPDEALRLGPRDRA